MSLIIPIAFCLLVFLYLGIYNTVIRRRNAIDQAWASIEAMLSKRYDLIPNLVATVMQYMSHERELLDSITQLRTQAQAANSKVPEGVMADDALTKSLSGLLVSVENYPDLKANASFVQLQKSWMEVEEQISAARRFYNAAVVQYNNSIQVFPNTLIASIHSMKPTDTYEAEAIAHERLDAKELFS